MSRQRIVKFQAAEALYFLRYNIVQDNCVAKPLLLN